MIFLIESNSLNWILNLTLLLLDLFTGNFGNEIYVFELFHIASNGMDMLYLDYLTWYSDLHLFGLNQYLHSFFLLFILVKINFYQYDLNMIFLIKSNKLNLILNLTLLLDLFIDDFGNEIYVFELFQIVSNRMDMLYLDYLIWYSDLHLFVLKQYLYSFLILFVLVQINFYQYDLNMIFLIKSNSLNWILNLTVLLDLFINKVFIIMGILLFLANCSIYRFLTPFGNFKIYHYFLSFHFPFDKYMVKSVLRRAENFLNLTNYEQYNCYNHYKTSLHIG